ncbi:MAG: hypothetical protein ACLPXT_02425 [Terracidiphilus sp.]
MTLAQSAAKNQGDYLSHHVGIIWNVPSRYDRVLAKYEWAKKQVNELEDAVDDFRRTNRYDIRRHDDIERGTATFWIDAVPPIPDSISLKIGDALHNLRSTLDHLAWSLVEAAGSIPDAHTSFPIFDTPKTYIAMSRGRVKGIGKYCLEAIDSIAPYKGGFGHWAWQLHKLDIVDKHRLLLTVTSVPIGRTMLPSEKVVFGSGEVLMKPEIRAAAIAQAFGFDFPYPLRPVQANDVLITVPLSEVDEKMGFTFDIALSESDYVSLIPVFLLMRSFASEVLRVINELARFL